MNWHIAFGEAEASLRQLGWKVLGAAAVMLAGFVLATVVRRLLARILWRRLDFSRRRFFLPAVVSLAILLVSFVLALVVLGVGGQVIGVMVTVGVALGLFADSFAGLRLLGSRAFQIGDTIEVFDKNIVGMVVSTNLIGTTLQTEDGSRVLLPNQMIFNNPVKNRSSDSSRGVVSLQFVVTPKTDIDDLQKAIQKMIASVGDRGNNSMSEILVTRIEKDAVTLKVRFATRPDQRRLVASEFLKTADTEFGRSGVQVHSLALLEEETGAKKS